jgi:DNA (cytosine-5)-methyltransferase 1
MSLAGRRRGFHGAESSAFFGFAEAIERLGDDRPALLLLENVTGFLASHDGRDFQAAVERLAELGYWIDSFILDAKDFVPQSRPRLFVLGCHETLDSPLLVKAGQAGGFLADPWRRAIESSSRLRPQRLRSSIGRIELPTGWATVPLRPPRRRPYELADFLDLDDQQDWWNAELVGKHYAMMSASHRRRVDQWLADGERKVATVYRRIRQGQQRAEVRFDGVAGCLRTPRGGSARQIVLLADAGRLRMRWMSPREYARLQGADSYMLEQPTSRALFGFGDAVCVPVICWIDQCVLTPIFDTSKRPMG